MQKVPAEQQVPPIMTINGSMALGLVSKEEDGVCVELRAGDTQFLGRQARLGVPGHATRVSKEHCKVTAFSTVSGQLALQLEAKKRLAIVDGTCSIARILEPGECAQVRWD